MSRCRLLRTQKLRHHVHTEREGVEAGSGSETEREEIHPVLQQRKGGGGAVLIARNTHVCTGPEDRASAMAMITEAAVAYDKSSPASFSLGAFEGATMSPLVFKEQLRRYERYFRRSGLIYAHLSGDVTLRILLERR